jgi:FkbM family methyltransferase
MDVADARRGATIEYCAETIISTAQNNEDVLLFRAFRGKRDGFYIDIGAGDPNWDSVTNWFYRMGWRGLNIEPNPVLYNILQRWRPDEININMGVSNATGELTYHQVLASDVGWGWGLSSFLPAAEDAARQLGFEVRRMPVPVTTLNAIVETHCSQRKIDFLKIDVEGFEERIIGATDWWIVRPLVLCIEATDLHGHPSHAGWEPYLQSQGYEFALFDGTNSFYVTSDRPDILSQFNAGVNSHDRYRKAVVEDFVMPRS